MPWECGECGIIENEENAYLGNNAVKAKIDVVCHHCGKPLCQKHRTFIKDEVFSEIAEPISQSAYHCYECKKKYHS